MKMKVFHADTMYEAIRAIKEELGPDALILSTKRVRRGSLPLGWSGRAAARSSTRSATLR